MRKIRQALRNFFFPPPGSPALTRLLPYATLGVLTLIVFGAGVVGWEYTNSPEFCGTACHTMPPEYTSYLTSPHARIDCVECHIGRDFLATRVTRKAGDIRHIVSLAFQRYEFPIRADDLRPARETCERCHFPEKFSDDSLREIRRFLPDETSTPETTYLVLKTGGGSARLGLGRGIHWHIENPVYYYALDPEEQVIPYVRYQNEDGSITEYVDITSGFDPNSIDEADLEEMDCITCHNRITHLVYPPEDSVDRLLARDALDRSIPEVRRKAVEALGADYATDAEALDGIARLADYYASTYPDFTAENSAAIDQLVEVLQETYTQSVFREQKSDWNSHPNNIGHQNSPGCFRCHDGKHLDADDQAIRLECNLCHSVPVVAGPNDFVSEIEISRGPEPQSHLNPNWIALHRDAFDTTCANCHTTEDAGGTSNSSFCSNSSCHGSAWPFAGFDAPALRDVLRSQLPAPEPTQPPPPPPSGESTWDGNIGALLEAKCGSCHGPDGLQGLDLTSYAAALRGGQGGPAIVPDDPESSLLMAKQTGSQPHFGQLDAAALDLVRAWIADGAPED
ncbi:MAG TPA: NapC/NirT family cytochrome c [Anaerolineales bacterium]|nr:NapC/NirT family cytochrome c [Anaerolineales bacterium]